jgi:hypothetical protein
VAIGRLREEAEVVRALPAQARGELPRGSQQFRRFGRGILKRVVCERRPPEEWAAGVVIS